MFGVYRCFEPSARMNPLDHSACEWLKAEGLPAYQPIDSPPCRARIARSLAPISSSAVAHEMRSNPPAAVRRIGYSSRSGSFCTCANSMPFGHEKPFVIGMRGIGAQLDQLAVLDGGDHPAGRLADSAVRRDLDGGHDASSAHLGQYVADDGDQRLAQQQLDLLPGERLTADPFAHGGFDQAAVRADGRAVFGARRRTGRASRAPGGPQCRRPQPGCARSRGRHRRPRPR